ncbi:MAG: hypothetical protein L0Y72_28805 [Gemmataceae bacterium]|nr:hypothetical protein [Gemmataceae bacterium]MCI0743048.1 hypothetical protein [Gemmataceae bacterium]
MRRIPLLLFGLGALLVLVNAGRSGEDKDLRGIIDKALAAHGGEANLAKFKAQSVKGAGKFYGLGEAIDFNIEVIAQDDKQFRFAIDLKIMGADLKVIAVVNGDKGWEKVNDDVKEMSAEEVAEHKEQMHSDAVASLLPLKNKAYKLATLGDVKVGDQPAVGVRVSKKGHRDVNLYFDKSKGQLIKSEYVVKDIKAGGDTEITQTTFYHDYKESQGIRHPTKLLIERDGKKFSDTLMSEIQLFEKVDNSTFNRP